MKAVLVRKSSLTIFILIFILFSLFVRVSFSPSSVGVYTIYDEITLSKDSKYYIISSDGSIYKIYPQKIRGKPILFLNNGYFALHSVILREETRGSVIYKYLTVIHPCISPLKWIEETFTGIYDYLHNYPVDFAWIYISEQDNIPIDYLKYSLKNTKDLKDFYNMFTIYSIFLIREEDKNYIKALCKTDERLYNLYKYLNVYFYKENITFEIIPDGFDGYASVLVEIRDLDENRKIFEKIYDKIKNGDIIKINLNIEKSLVTLGITVKIYREYRVTGTPTPKNIKTLTIRIKRGKLLLFEETKQLVGSIFYKEFTFDGGWNFKHTFGEPSDFSLTVAAIYPFYFCFGDEYIEYPIKYLLTHKNLLKLSKITLEDFLGITFLSFKFKDLREIASLIRNKILQQQQGKSREILESILNILEDTEEIIVKNKEFIPSLPEDTLKNLYLTVLPSSTAWNSPKITAILLYIVRLYGYYCYSVEPPVFIQKTTSELKIRNYALIPIEFEISGCNIRKRFSVDPGVTKTIKIDKDKIKEGCIITLKQISPAYSQKYNIIVTKDSTETNSITFSKDYIVIGLAILALALSLLPRKKEEKKKREETLAGLEEFLK